MSVFIFGESTVEYWVPCHWSESYRAYRARQKALRNRKQQRRTLRRIQYAY